MLYPGPSFPRVFALGITMAFVTLNADGLRAQSPAQASRAFEVASVKSHPPGDPVYSIGTAGGDRLVASNVPLRLLVQWAYPLPSGRLFLDSQIFGGPRWIGTDRFDVQGKAEAGARPVPFEQLRLMAQSLLEDRFQLKTHREMRELPVYALVPVKTGAKMKLADDQTPPPHSFAFGRGQHHAVGICHNNVAVGECTAGICRPARD